jgi:hypothetical protein
MIQDLDPATDDGSKAMHWRLLSGLQAKKKGADEECVGAR